MQGFVFMSFILISLFNTRFHSHLVSFHFCFFKNKVNNFTCDLLFSFLDIRIKKYHKNSQANSSLTENVSVFWLHLLALISRRNVGMRGLLRKEIILLKYQYFRFRTKTGAHFELLNWLEKSTKAFDVGGLWYCSFYHPLGQFQNSETCITRKSGTGTTFSASSIFTHTCIPLFDLYTTANDKGWCEVQNALKAV